MSGGVVYVSRDRSDYSATGSSLIIRFNVTIALSGCRLFARGAVYHCVQFYRFVL